MVSRRTVQKRRELEQLLKRNQPFLGGQHADIPARVTRLLERGGQHKGEVCSDLGQVLLTIGGHLVLGANPRRSSANGATFSVRCVDLAINWGQGALVPIKGVGRTARQAIEQAWTYCRGHMVVNTKTWRYVLCAPGPDAIPAHAEDPAGESTVPEATDGVDHDRTA